MMAELGCVGLVVDSKPEATEFYARYGFKSLQVLEGNLPERPAPVPMFLSIGSTPKKRP